MIRATSTPFLTFPQMQELVSSYLQKGWSRELVSTRMHAGKERRRSLRLLSMRGRSTTRFDSRRECDRQGQQIWRIEGEGGTAHPSNTRGSALQPGCWPGAAWLLGFHSQGFAREATPTTIGLIGKGFSPFFHE